MNTNTSPEKKNSRSTVLRWELVAIAVVMVLILAAVSIPGWTSVSRPAQLVVYGSLFVLGGFILYVTVFRWRALEIRLTDTEAALEQTRVRLGLVIRLGQELALAEDEDAAIALSLDTCLAVAGSRGVSYLPYDVRGHARPIVSRGLIDPDNLKQISDHLALPSVRHACARCSMDNPRLHADCALPLPDLRGVDQILCLPVGRFGNDFGLMNVYLGPVEQLDAEGEAFLTAALDELAIVIEAIRLRNREKSMDFPSGTARGLDFSFALPRFAETYFRLAGADFLVVSTNFLPENQPEITCSYGRIPAEYEFQVLELLSSAAHGHLPSAHPAKGTRRAYGVTVPILIAASMRDTGGELTGGLVMGWGVYGSRSAWSPARVQAAADGLALVREITEAIRRLEYRTLMTERNRLAREIHDGLAQSIGYLKLLSARMSGYLEAGDLTRLAEALADSRAALDETYQDARTAIDDLIVSPELGFSAWVERVGQDFQQSTGTPTHLASGRLELEPPEEVQAQIIRILQESLTNVRKHASADQVWIDWFEKQSVLTLEIRDDGYGFHPDLLLDSSQHGLLSMRERAELIGADIQVVSSANEGTIVRLKLPLKIRASES
ncbi:MAG: sensor histidine kinase [Anaerolineales bacterium]|nr:sensor histidine kinase [Anaerolineales bacterium]